MKKWFKVLFFIALLFLVLLFCYALGFDNAIRTCEHFGKDACSVCVDVLKN